MNEQIEIIRSGRRTISVEIKADMRIIVRAPAKMKRADIDKFIEDRTPWIEKHLNMMRERQAAEDRKAPTEPYAYEQIEALAEQALSAIPPKVEAFASAMGITYGRITVRGQVSRWGSCTAKGNLNFNCLLMLCPEEVLDYVIIHELCHRKHMDHSKDFWAMVERYCPDYRTSRQWLADNGGDMIARLRKTRNM